MDWSSSEDVIGFYGYNEDRESGTYLSLPCTEIEPDASILRRRESTQVKTTPPPPKPPIRPQKTYGTFPTKSDPLSLIELFMTYCAPRKWTARMTEETGPNNMFYQVYLRNLWLTYKFNIKFVSIGLFLIISLYTTTKIYAHLSSRPVIYWDNKGEIIENVYWINKRGLHLLQQPSDVSSWLSNLPEIRIPPISRSELERGYIQNTKIIHYGDTKVNMTLSHILSLMNSSCQIENGCTCVSAIQIGIHRSIMLLNAKDSTQMYKTYFYVDPIVTDVSNEYIEIYVDDLALDETIEVNEGVTLPAAPELNYLNWKQVPTWMTIEYKSVEGDAYRQPVYGEASACICYAMSLANVDCRNF